MAGANIFNTSELYETDPDTGQLRLRVGVSGADQLLKVNSSDQSTGYLDAKTSGSEGITAQTLDLGGSALRRDFKLDFNSLTELTTPDGNLDFMAIYDADAASHKKVTISNIAQNIPLKRITGSTYSSLQHLQNTYHSSGVFSGGMITDNLDGTVSVATGTGGIRATDSTVDDIYFFDWPAKASLALTNDSQNYIYAEYNGGTPQVVASATERTDYQTNVLLGTVYKNGSTAVHIFQANRLIVGDHGARMVKRSNALNPFARESGAIVGETGTRNLTVTAGAFWQGLERFTTSAFNSSTGGTFSYFYRNGSGGFTEVTGQTQVTNSQYDDGSGTLQSLTAGRYAVSWIYLEADSSINLLYGRGNYTLVQAQSANAPSPLPGRLDAHGRLIGKVIVQSAASTFTELLSTFEEALSLGGVTVHSELSGLQGGTTDQYYHLTSAEYSLITGNAFALLAGRAGGQSLIGGTGAGDDLNLQSTSNVTRGSINLNDDTVITGDLGVTGAITFEGGNFTFNDGGNNYDVRFEGQNRPYLFFCDASNDAISIGGQGSWTTQATLSVEQYLSNGNKPTMYVRQNDADVAFMHFVGTSSADAANNISTWTVATIVGHLKWRINNVDYWIPFTSAPTS